MRIALRRDIFTIEKNPGNWEGCGCLKLMIARNLAPLVIVTCNFLAGDVCNYCGGDSIVSALEWPN